MIGIVTHSCGSLRDQARSTSLPFTVSLSSYVDDVPSQSRSPTARAIALAPSGSGAYSYVYRYVPSIENASSRQPGAVHVDASSLHVPPCSQHDGRGVGGAAVGGTLPVAV